MDYAKKNPMTIVLIATAILVLYLAFYAIYMLQREDLNGEILIGNPVKASTYRMVPADKIPKALNGEESSMSFWIYINDLTSGSYKHVAHRGSEDYDTSGGLLKGSPFIYLDRNSNRLFIRFDTNTTRAQYPDVDIKATGGNGAISIVNSDDQTEIEDKLGKTSNIYDLDGKSYSVTGSTGSWTATSAPDGDLYFTNKSEQDEGDLDKNTRTLHRFDRNGNEVGVNDNWSGISIDYIPLQKWTNITYVVKEKEITLFLDGDIYKTVTRGSQKLDQHDTDNLYIGGKAPTPQSQPTGNSGLDQGKAPTTFNGYLSKFEYFNYALPLSTIKNVYSRGPMDKGFTETLGLPNLGVQSPVYIKEDL